MTAPRYPKNIAPSAFLPSVLRQGVVLAGGLLPPVQAEYFRIGHMGSVTFGDILAVIGSVEIALAENGYEFEAGKGIAAANSVFQSYQKLKYGR
jgi:alanine-glyoxylate transaminase/serine-glyoxylate transaminase/serine-pyruvate transaminase